MKTGLARKILGRASLLGRGDIVAGSREEAEAAERIRGAFEELGLDAEVYRFECMSWAEKHVELEAGGTQVRAVALPYTPSGDVEARLVYAGEGLEEQAWERLGAEDKVVLLKWFGKLDEAVWQYIEAVRHGAAGVILYDPYPGRVRRMVMALSTDYRFGGGTPPYVPAISVSFEDGMRLLRLARRGAKVRMYTETSVRHGAVSGVVYAGNLEEVVVTAHMDKWLTGFSDNSLGVALVLEAAERLGGDAGYIVFGAEESGAPGYSPWYWIWGSRSFVSWLERRGLVDTLGPVVNLDVLGGPRVHVSASGPGYRKGLEETLGDGYTYGWDEAIYDSFSFTLAGLPAATLNTYDYVQPVYHTDLDLDVYTVWEGVGYALSAVEEIASRFSRERWGMIEYGELVETLRRRVEEFSWAPESREVLRLLDGLKVCCEEEARRFRRMLAAPIYRGRYETTYRDFEYSYPYILEAARDLSAQAAELRRIPGVERILPSVEKPFYGRHPVGMAVRESEEALRSIARQALGELAEALRELKR